MTKSGGQEICMCLSGEQYRLCCGRFHSGQAEAATAEQLMRSRYSAFVLLDEQYLLRTWHPDKAPAELELGPDLKWRRLDIVSMVQGGPLDTFGTVEFKAYFRHGDDRGIHHEISRFVRENKRWFYLDGTVLD